VEVNLNPTRRRSDILTMVLSAPAFYETHSNGALLGVLVYCFVAVINGLAQEMGKLLIAEDFKSASRWDLADGGGMEAVAVVAIATLHENGRVAQAFCVHLAAYIIQMNAFANVTACVLNGGIAINVRKEAQTKALVII